MKVSIALTLHSVAIGLGLVPYSTAQQSFKSTEVWDFDPVSDVVVTTEMLSPVELGWERFTRVPVPSATDYADVSQRHGVVIKSLVPLHKGAAPVTVLNDGKAQGREIDTKQSAYFPNKSTHNRILVDLSGLVPIYQVNTYSWHQYHRKNQQHKLFFTVSETPSDPNAVPLGEDWLLLGAVNTDYPVEPRGKVGVSFSGAKGAMIAKARQLLFVVEDPQCFYGEIDVVTEAVTVQDSKVGSGADLPKHIKETRLPSVYLSRDTLHGYFERVSGVRGEALKFDGFSSKVVRPALHTEPLGDAFTIEAWVAPQEFSQNQTAIINQAVNRETGYFFGVEKEGKLLFQANIDGKWQVCKSSEPLPILYWSHVAATFDPQVGMTVYIDGKPMGRNAAKGKLVRASEADLWIGMSLMKQAPDVHTRRGDPGYMVWDGLIDEMQIHNLAFSEKQIQEAFSSVKPAVAQPLQYRKLPSGPHDGKHFGAFYTRLKYAPEWEKQWRVGDLADVVVTFEDPRANFVFWRGTSYIPHWVSNNGIWYNNQFVERLANSDGCQGCIEPMSDKRCRFSHVRVIESNPARIRIHWRYAPVGLNYKQPFIDPFSGEGDCVDEYYTIYPDMVGVRSITLHSTAIDEKVDWQESIIVHQPGREPEDNIEATAVSIGNLAGDAVEYTWPGVAKKGGSFDGLPERPCIQVVNLKSELRPFMIVPPSHGIKVHKFRGHSQKSIFHWWNHWPISQGRTTGTNAPDSSRPSHSSLSGWNNWELHRSTQNSKTRLMLHGMTDKGVKDLVGLAQAWISPATLSIASDHYRSVGFDREQKAYVIERTEASIIETLKLQLAASAEAPVVNPAIVVKKWPQGARAQLTVAGKTLPTDRVKIGIERNLDGQHLVVWLKLTSHEPVDLELRPYFSDL